jgi:hypothetical protein
MLARRASAVQPPLPTRPASASASPSRLPLRLFQQSQPTAPCCSTCERGTLQLYCAYSRCLGGGRQSGSACSGRRPAHHLAAGNYHTGRDVGSSDLQRRAEPRLVVLRASGAIFVCQGLLRLSALGGPVGLVPPLQDFIDGFVENAEVVPARSTVLLLGDGGEVRLEDFAGLSGFGLVEGISNDERPSLQRV